MCSTLYNLQATQLCKKKMIQPKKMKDIPMPSYGALPDEQREAEAANRQGRLPALSSSL
jgi:hypothetical protein